MARAVEVAHRAGKKVMAHAEGTEGIKAAVRAGVDSIEHGTLLDEEGAKLMEQHGTWLVPTAIASNGTWGRGSLRAAILLELRQRCGDFERTRPGFSRALDHHLKIAYGVDDEPEFVSQEFGALVRGGMKPIEALRAATINGAELTRPIERYREP